MVESLASKGTGVKHDFDEPDVGIQEFLNTDPETSAIPCTVKHRFSDFIVNEID